VRALIAIAVLASLTGCVSTGGGPASPGVGSAKERLAAFERDASYEGRWQAASVCADLADEDQEHLARDERESYARRGKDLAEKAIALEDGEVEGHFYRALCIGRLLQAERLPSVSLVTVMRDEAERAAKLDETFEHAGAHRFLGSLYCEAPSWGPGGVGDEEKAEEHFQAALRVAGDWPENLLAYAKHLIKDDRCPLALELIAKGQKLADESTELDEQQKREIRLEAIALKKQIP
jgi:hypothetical protein